MLVSAHGTETNTHSRLPTETKGIAMGVVQFLTTMGLFRGQSPGFFATLTTLAQQADAARRHGYGQGLYGSRTHSRFSAISVALDHWSGGTTR